ncbi:protamine-like protein [Apis mellifera]|uniref:Protamine-like protein n=1 Tax=Apis mellifera TaxID=7460 RepID=A0A7M7SRI7_APIME|nr:protamine-like protein [Apis mellifera]XP_026300447.1 protamine-like protein [Apis mellifera]|eukprot:XP_026300445.1 protamine-like protein [Apis mellifera]
MVSDSSKILGLVIKAIKNLRELKGSTSKEILHYLSSVYDILPNVARRQMQTALKRGVAYGILKKNGGHYILPTNGDIKCQEIAEQEVNLLDACRRSRMQRKMGCKCKKRRNRGRRKRRFCRCKPRRRRRRRAARGGCRTRRRRRRSRSRRRRKRKCPCGGTGRSGNLDRLKRAPTSQQFDKFFPRKSLEGYDSAVSEKSSLSSASSME